MNQRDDVLNSIRDQLIDGHEVARRSVRSRRHAKALLGAALFATAIAIAIVAGGESTRPPSERVDAVADGSASTSTSNMNDASTDTTLDQGTVDTGSAEVLFAAATIDGGVGLADLATGDQRTLDRREQSMADGSISGMLYVEDKLLVGWENGKPANSFSAHSSDGDRLANLVEALMQPGVPLGTITSERQVGATSDGARLWILASTPTGSSAAIEFVSTSDGEILLSGQVSGGSTLVGVVRDVAVVETITADGTATYEMLSPDSQRQILVPPDDNLQLLTIGSEASVWLSPDGADLIIVSETTVTVPAPDLMRWIPTGRVPIPSNSPRLKIVDEAQSRLLVGLGFEGNPNFSIHSLALVNLDGDHAWTVIETVEDYDLLTAFWDRTDGRIVAITLESNNRALRLIELDPIRSKPGIYPFSDDYGVLAAG